MLSLTNKYPAFVFLIYLVLLIPVVTLSSLQLVQLIFSFSPVVHFVLFVSHISRCHSTSSFSNIPNHLWCPTRLCPWSHFVQSLYCTLVLSSPLPPSHIYSVPMTHIFLYPSSRNWLLIRPRSSNQGQEQTSLAACAGAKNVHVVHTGLQVAAWFGSRIPCGALQPCRQGLLQSKSPVGK